MDVAERGRRALWSPLGPSVPHSPAMGDFTARILPLAEQMLQRAPAVDGTVPLELTECIKSAKCCWILGLTVCYYTTLHFYFNVLLPPGMVL